MLFIHLSNHEDHFNPAGNIYVQFHISNSLNNADDVCLGSVRYSALQIVHSQCPRCNSASHTCGILRFPWSRNDYSIFHNGGLYFTCCSACIFSVFCTSSSECRLSHLVDRESEAKLSCSSVKAAKKSCH